MLEAIDQVILVDIKVRSITMKTVTTQSISRTVCILEDSSELGKNFSKKKVFFMDLPVGLKGTYLYQLNSYWNPFVSY